jgi:hypothetical protein
MESKILPGFIKFAALFVLITGCAKISSPTGGPRDKLPPVVIKSVPVNKSVNYRNQSIVITFDEYVVLDNINDKFMVSPPMKKKPRVFIRGKNVNVEFDDKLKDSTTYTFYFQDAIRDLNEGNILENYQFVFSTGAVIDSLSVTGNVYNAFNLEAPESTLALLYRELADSAVVKHLPDYITKVNPDGYFRIDNVRAGTYKLYALKDADNSKNYNLNSEEFAFMNDSVVISTGKNYIPVVKDTSTIKKIVAKALKTAPLKGKVKVPEPVTLTGEYPLILFAAQKKAHYLTSSNRSQKYQMIYTLSLPPDSMKFDFLIPGSGEDKYLLERSRNNDTLKVWLTDSLLYSQPQISTIVTFPFTDTLGILGYKKDTIMMRFLAPRAPRVARVKKPAFTFDSNIKSGSLKPGQPIYFTSQTPFRQPDTSRIRIYEVSDSSRKKITYSFFKDSTNLCRYFMKANIINGKKYLFIADWASFGNIYKENSDSIGLRFSEKDPQSYSKLEMVIHNYEGDRIIQLLDKDEKLVREEHMKKDGAVLFPLLENGFYRVRVIYDLNGDGKWTTGDFDLKRQPEPVSYYHSEIEIKTGWDIVGQDWDISVKNFKDPKLREKKKAK